MTDGIKIADLHKTLNYGVLGAAEGWSEAEVNLMCAIDPNHNGVIDNKKECKEIKEFLKRADKGVGGNRDGVADYLEIYRAGQRGQMYEWNLKAGKVDPLRISSRDTTLGRVEDAVKTSEKWVYYQGIIDAAADAIKK